MMSCQPTNRQVARQNETHLCSCHLVRPVVLSLPPTQAIFSQSLTMRLQGHGDTFLHKPAIARFGKGLGGLFTGRLLKKPLPKLNKRGKEIVGVVHLNPKGTCDGHHDYRRMHQLRCM